MELEISFTSDGKVILPWWTPKAAELICSLCGHNGWQRFGPITPDEFLSEDKEKEYGPCFRCNTRHPWCG